MSTVTCGCAVEKLVVLHEELTEWSWKAHVAECSPHSNLRALTPCMAKNRQAKVAVFDPLRRQSDLVKRQQFAQQVNEVP